MTKSWKKGVRKALLGAITDKPTPWDGIVDAVKDSGVEVYSSETKRPNWLDVRGVLHDLRVEGTVTRENNIVEERYMRV